MIVSLSGRSRWARRSLEPRGAQSHEHQLTNAVGAQVGHDPEETMRGFGAD